MEPNRVHSARRPLLVYCTYPGWLRGSRIWWNEDWQGRPKYSEKTCPSANLPTTNPTLPDPGANPGRRGGNPASNRWSYGAASDDFSFRILCWPHVMLLMRKLQGCAVERFLYRRGKHWKVCVRIIESTSGTPKGGTTTNSRTESTERSKIGYKNRCWHDPTDLKITPTIFRNRPLTLIVHSLSWW
jgi:hypothetical protein